jgi:hypothetical protein
LRPVRIELDGLVVVGNRLLIFALEIPGGAAIGIGQCEIRLQPQRLVIVFDRAVVFAGVVEDVGTDFITLGIVRLEPDGLVQRAKRRKACAGLGLSAMT